MSRPTLLQGALTSVAVTLALTILEILLPVQLYHLLVFSLECGTFVAVFWIVLHINDIGRRPNGGGRGSR